MITVFKTIFSDSGVPMALVTDNATCFINEDFEDASSMRILESFQDLGTLNMSCHPQGIPKEMLMWKRPLVWSNRYILGVKILYSEC